MINFPTKAKTWERNNEDNPNEDKFYVLPTFNNDK